MSQLLSLKKHLVKAVFVSVAEVSSVGIGTVGVGVVLIETVVSRGDGSVHCKKEQSQVASVMVTVMASYSETDQSVRVDLM